MTPEDRLRQAIEPARPASSRQPTPCPESRRSSWTPSRIRQPQAPVASASARPPPSSPSWSGCSCSTATTTTRWRPTARRRPPPRRRAPPPRPSTTTTTVPFQRRRPGRRRVPGSDHVAALRRPGRPLTTPSPRTSSGSRDPVVGAFQQGDGRSGEVEVRGFAEGAPTVVLVRQLEDDTWFVIGATTDSIRLATPALGATITSPQPLTGMAYAYEGTVPVAALRRRRAGADRARPSSPAAGTACSVTSPASSTFDERHRRHPRRAGADEHQRRGRRARRGAP